MIFIIKNMGAACIYRGCCRNDSVKYGDRIPWNGADRTGGTVSPAGAESARTFDRGMAAHLLLPDGSGSYDSGLYPVHGQLLHFLSGGICNEPVFWVHSVFIELPLWCDRAGLYVCLHLSPVFCLYSAVCGNPSGSIRPDGPGASGKPAADIGHFYHNFCRLFGGKLYEPHGAENYYEKFLK